VSRVRTPTDRAHPWNQADPICRKHKKENGRKEPKCPFRQVRSDDSRQESIETFDEPLEKVLGAGRHLIHFLGRSLSKDNNADGNNPTHEHRVGDSESKRASNLYCLRRQNMRFWRCGVFGLLTRPPQRKRCYRVIFAQSQSSDRSPRHQQYQN